jgi:uncharacterized sulfatase
MTSFLAERRGNERRGMCQWLPTEAPTIARMLQSAGYRTGHFGKWHLGGQRDVGEAPLITEYGFDETLTQFEGLGDRILCTFDTFYQDQPHHAHILSIASEKLGRGNCEFVKRYEVTGRFVKRAIEFIDENQKTGTPFYMNVWPDDVHSPHEPSPANRGDGSEQARYEGVIHELDAQLAPLLDRVRNDPLLRDNTLIIFGSDHGPDPIVENASGLRGSKTNLYEGGIRVPWIVWWPAGQNPQGAAGSTNDTLIAGMDLPPTLLTIAGIEAPADVHFDGQDMTEAFRGGHPQRSGSIFWIRPPDRPGPNGSFHDLAVRHGKWKLLIELDGTRAELFDLEADPFERHNLAAAQPHLVAELAEELNRWRQTLPPDLLPPTNQKLTIQ